MWCEILTTHAVSIRRYNDWKQQQSKRSINYVQLSEGIKNFVIDSYIRYNKVVTKVFARHILFEMSFKFDHHFCVHNNSLNTLLDLLTLFMFKSRPDGSLMDHWMIIIYVLQSQGFHWWTVREFMFHILFMVGCELCGLLLLLKEWSCIKTNENWQPK